MARLEYLRIGRVQVLLDPDILRWQAHRMEIVQRMIELSELIHSLETGETEITPTI